MAHQLDKKYLKLGTGSGELSASDLNSNFAAPSNYTPTDVTIKGHLEGIDAVLTGNVSDINDTAFSLTNNQAAAANVTGLAFSNAAVRGAKIEYSITINATVGLFEKGELQIVQNATGWLINRESVGSDSQVNLTVTNSGQIQYTTPDYTGFVSGKIQFRAITNAI